MAAPKKPKPPASPTTPPKCSINDVSLAAISCAGFYDGNQNGGDSAKLGVQVSALKDLSTPFVYDSSKFSTLAKTSSISSGGQISFGQTLYGLTYFSVHFGGGAKVDGSATKLFDNGTGGGTAFYLIDAGKGLSSIALNVSAFSNAVLFATGAPPPPASPVPEPATWAMLVLGFGVMDAGLRARRRPGQPIVT